MEQELINKMASAVASQIEAAENNVIIRLNKTVGFYEVMLNETEFCGGGEILSEFSYEDDAQEFAKKFKAEYIAKAALAAIQEDYVLVRKEVVEVVDDLKEGDIIQYKDGVEFGLRVTEFHREIHYIKQVKAILSRKNKPAINKKDIVG